MNYTDEALTSTNILQSGGALSENKQLPLYKAQYPYLLLKKCNTNKKYLQDKYLWENTEINLKVSSTSLLSARTDFGQFNLFV